jgi:ComF family protein
MMHLFIPRLFQFLLPSRCPCCERFLEEGYRGICPNCLLEIHWIEPPFCSRCGTPFASKEIESHLCGDCMTRKGHVTAARALGHYEGTLQELIHRWKYEGKVHLSPLFGDWMARGLNHHWPPRLFDLLIPVPLHIHRLRERGFNQALLLAKEVSRQTGLPYRSRTLRKRKPTVPQVSLSSQERRKGVRDVFHVAQQKEVEGKTILLVDDVYTTGATVNECAKVLLAEGAKRVDVLTLAHAVRNS